MLWACKIPGKPGTPWEGEIIAFTLQFSQDHPQVPPVCWMTRSWFHPNVCPISARLCCWALRQDGGWKPNMTILEILQGVQDTLAVPNVREDWSVALHHAMSKDTQEKVLPLLCVGDALAKKYGLSGDTRFMDVWQGVVMVKVLEDKSVSPNKPASKAWMHDTKEQYNRKLWLDIQAAHTEIAAAQTAAAAAAAAEAAAATAAADAWQAAIQQNHAEALASGAGVEHEVGDHDD